MDLYLLDYVGNEIIRRELDIVSVTAKINRYIEEWRGNVNTMDATRIPRQILNYQRIEKWTWKDLNQICQ